MKVKDTRDQEVGWVRSMQYSETQAQYVFLVEVKRGPKRVFATWLSDHCEAIE